MGAVLIDAWLAGADALEVRDDASVSQARELVRARAAAVGLDAGAGERAAAAVSELARNQLRHASLGVVGVRTVSRGGVAGLEVIAADRGPGIADPTAALAGAVRISGSLGVGVAAAYRQFDEMDLDVRWGEGTCVWGRIFVAPVARSEVGILSRAAPGESVSGDHATVVRGPAGLTIAVADGLGHGPLARDPANRAIAVVSRRAEAPLDELLVACNTEVDDTRGAVMAVGRLDPDRTTFAHAGVGNVSTRVIAKDGHLRILPSLAGVLGTSPRLRRIEVERVPLAADDLIVIASDGITSRVDVTGDLAVLRQPPLVIAHHLLTRFGRADDDILVAVVR